MIQRRQIGAAGMKGNGRRPGGAGQFCPLVEYLRVWVTHLYYGVTRDRSASNSAKGNLRRSEMNS